MLLNPFVPGNKLMGSESISRLFEDYKAVLVKLPLLQSVEGEKAKRS